MTALLRELESAGRDAAHVLARLAAERDFPIVEGTTALFAYRGRASEVELRHWIYGLSTTQAFRQLPGTDVWVLEMDLPEGSRVEYKIEVAEGPFRRLVRDELNPHIAHDPFGANSVVHGTGYGIPEWTREDPEARRGEIVEHTIDSAAFGGPRTASVYLPARFRPTRRYPLLVVHDGPDYLRFSGLQTVFDNLIHRLELPPLIAALIRSDDRIQEYADDERHAAFVADELVPRLEGTYPCLGTPAARGLVGASFGGVAALSTAWRRPGVFGRLLLQSGSFAFTDIGDHDRGPAFDRVVEFVNAFRAAPGKPSERVFVTCGTYESMIYYNRSMVPLLERTGMDVRYVEARDGHNWENWRDRLREGLSWLFPGPLWVVYE